MEVDYKKTLNLPKTDFPMKANLTQKEPIMLKKWNEEKLNDKFFKNRVGNKKYILHDGPPYANGHIHLGHSLNKILKDIIIKYKTMQGYDAPYIPGWDCHGLPVEHQLFKELGLTKHQIDQLRFRKKAAKYAGKFVKIQCEEFKRLGIFASWDKPYLTQNYSYEATIARVFGDFYLKGYIYKGLKPIYWCGCCETALAEAEVEYDNHVSPSIYVKFKIKSDKNNLLKDYTDTSFVIWTTTPWTLPANLAIALKDDFEYSLISTDKGIFIIAKELIDNFTEKISVSKYEVLKSFMGKELEGIITQHPFIDRESPIILADHVTLEQGTGAVHTAPGHGQDDYVVGMKYGLEILSPVTNQGNFIDTLPLFGGKQVFEANKEVIEHLKSINALLFTENIKHSYPHCWRCKQPVIFRATEQWFIKVDEHNMRNIALEKIRQTNWIPATGENRITSMVENRPDWCLSRQRYWGVPIPVFYCKGCRKDILTKETIDNVEKLFMQEGADAWFSHPPEDFATDMVCPECGGKEFEKETDIIDVWFDSGVSHQAVIGLRDELTYPADLYLEGSDQHRGWFQSSLLTAVGCNNTSPFKTVLTHGFIVDGDGKKMSKSMGNVISPDDIIKKYGADILRLWIASVDYTGDIRISNEIITQLSDAYRRIRNSFKYLMGNINDFDPEKNTVPYNSLDEIDRWALSRIESLGAKVTSLYDNFEFYKIFHAIHHFCVVDLSSFYLDSLKDRMYTANPNDPLRRSSQTVIYKITDYLVKMLAPILVFTTEEVFSYFNKNTSTQNSIHLSDWPKFNEKLIDNGLEEKWDKILELRTEVQKVLEHFRKEKLIGTSLEAKVVLYSDSPEYLKFIEDNKNILKTVFIVSQVELSDTIDGKKDLFTPEKIKDIKIYVEKADGTKCVRCWNYTDDVDSDRNYPKICARCVNAIKNI